MGRAESVLCSLPLGAVSEVDLRAKDRDERTEGPKMQCSETAPRESLKLFITTQAIYQAIQNGNLD